MFPLLSLKLPIVGLFPVSGWLSLPLSLPNFVWKAPSTVMRSLRCTVSSSFQTKWTGSTHTIVFYFYYLSLLSCFLLKLILFRAIIELLPFKHFFFVKNPSLFSNLSLAHCSRLYRYLTSDVTSTCHWTAFKAHI